MGIVDHVNLLTFRSRLGDSTTPISGVVQPLGPVGNNVAKGLQHLTHVRDFLRAFVFF